MDEHGIKNEVKMYFSYNKLWKRLIDEGINKQELRKLTGISTASISKMNQGKNINTDTLLKICRYFKCDVGDITEVVFSDRPTDNIKEEE